MADKIYKEAKKLAEIILETNTDDRAELFRKTAQVLAEGSQYFTANTFRELAKKHE